MTMHLSTSVSSTALMMHLLQSSAFAGAAWLLALALRHYPAHVRFWVWMSASVKFLFPFALLTSLGARLAKPQPVHSALYTLIEELNQPFAKAQPPAFEPMTSTHSLQGSSWVVWTLAAVWACGFLLMLFRWATQWRSAHRIVNDGGSLDQGPEIVALRNGEAEAQIRRPIPIVVTSKAVEPGVFGIVRPVLLWPSGLSEQLDDVHIGAIVAHELEHVRRRDNLSCAVHRIAQALFWFHPLVYWVGWRMSEERERACDESVIARITPPETYAESILKVCAFCLESPLPCVAGVSGSDLKKRVLRIMKGRSGLTLTLGRRVILASAALLAISLPIGFGVVHGQAVNGASTSSSSPGDGHDLPRYEVASVKPGTSEGGPALFRFTPDGISIQGLPPEFLLQQAFGIERDRIIGAPSWVRSKRFDIEAKVAPEDAPRLEKLKTEDRQAMLIPLLVERFNLKYHHETRELQSYALVIAKGGPKLVERKDLTPPEQAAASNLAGGPRNSDYAPGRMMMRPGHIEAQGTPIDMLIHPLAVYLGRSVVDKTSLTGRYDFTLQWTPDSAPPPMLGGSGGPGGPAQAEAASDAPSVSLLTAIQEQLGLKLESEKDSVDVIVIDHIDPPTPN
ncbi:MAG: M56 family metallopeptidase [Terracidiphilus sp.]